MLIKCIKIILIKNNVKKIFDVVLKKPETLEWSRCGNYIKNNN